MSRINYKFLCFEPEFSTNFDYFNIYEQFKFHAQLMWLDPLTKRFSFLVTPFILRNWSMKVDNLLKNMFYSFPTQIKNDFWRVSNMGRWE